METTMKTIRSLLQRLADAFGPDRSASLRGLDARTLADIGIDPSEFGSIEAEWLGRADLTRLRVVGELRHA
jgi:hypothetical protein